MRADIQVRIALLVVMVIVTATAILSLWLAGQLGGVLAHLAWPDSGLPDAPGIALRIMAHLDDPAQAWPRPARSDVAPAWLLYLLWLILLLGMLAGWIFGLARIAGPRVRRAGFVRKKDLDESLSADAVRARIDVVRPGLTVTEADDAATRAAKQKRRADPLEVARILGYDAVSGRPLYLANEYTRLAAAVPRVGGKTTRLVIPTVIDARGAVLTTSTRLDVAEITYQQRSAIGPTHIFEPQGEIPGVPRLRWSPIEGADDQIVAMLRAQGFADGSGIGAESVENGRWFRDQAATILRGLLHAAALDEHATMIDVLAWSQNPNNARPERILRHHGVHSWADRLTRHRETTGRARDTVQSVVAGALDCFNDPRVLLACSPPRGTQFKPVEWLHESGTLYLVGTRDAQALIAPLMAAVTEDILYQARRLALHAPGGRIEPALYFVGDEIANIAPIPSLPSLMTEGGGSGIVVDILTQNRHQLRERWGDKGGQAIADSANAWLLMGGSTDAGALKDAQAVAGQVIDVSSGASWGSGRASVNESARRENLLDPADLRTLPEGRAFALVRNLPPMELTIPAWWERPDADELKQGRDAFRRMLAEGSR
ncbi:TraM recognition domain-containing protein [Actinoplanes oblitus]|uniref:TraM recognition domain-containing protein n=1 Tax=Actinoplanes oblitus TaxID=3040509 RepID=A0ABY8WSL8_9ACTN|nr:type IV secretory system conjugative DNA transfer family protein [Actinoplanes oblitus]WIM99991.1 TraM recognition domain-containing protein [Actinoplanes oblitus]